MNDAVAPSPLHTLSHGWRHNIGLGLLLFLIVLIGLYWRAEAVDADQHLAYTQLLRDLRELDARIDGELLAHRLEFSRNYDALSRHTAAAQERAAHAGAVPAWLSDADRAAVQAAAGALADSLAQKATLVDAFKRNDAVLRNSLTFFPTAAAKLLDARLVPPLTAPMRQRIGNYVRTLQAYALLPSDDAGSAVARSASLLDATLLPAAHRPLVVNLRLHGDVVHQRLGVIDRLMKELAALPTGARLEALERAYTLGYGRALERAGLFRRFLYALIVLLATFLTHTFLRLERARQSLEAAHRELGLRHARLLSAEKQLTLHATAFRSAHDGITLTDAAGNILEVNPAFTRITGYERDEVIGKNPRLLKSGRHDRAFYAAMWQSLNETGNWSGEIWNRNKYGEIYPEMLSIAAVRDETGRLTNYVGVFTDISRIKAQEQQLAQIAYYDALTELPNRVLLADRLLQGIAQTRRSHATMAVCYLDLDGFKPINDTWGHDAGDKVLVEMAQRLQQALRGGDTVARLGGDEFVLLLLGLNGSDDCNEAIERLLRKIAQPIDFLPEAATITASIGVTLFPIDDADPDALLRHADQAMYQAKQAGKNRYHVFDPEQDRTVRSRHDRLARIRQALENREFVLHYQPQVDMRQGRVVGAEALIRWNHPERGLVPPGEFLPLVENDDLIKLIGDWVIESALVQMEAWQAAGLDLAVSVNIASRQLQAPEFVEKLKAALHLHPGVAPRLELEVLETAALEDVVKTSRVIDACRELGVHFALDDFGTGYSSLTYLKRLPAETIKIDQSFVREILSDYDNLVIVQGVIGLANAFQRGIVAEGVETPEHGRLLLQLECDMAQGYGIARPMPGDQLADWVRQWRPAPVWEPFRHRAWDNRDYPMLVAEIRLRNWANQIVFAANEGRPPPQKYLEDPRRCGFGRWYFGHGLQHYGLLPAYAPIDAPHRRLHEIAVRMDRLWREGDLQSLRGLIPELLAARDDTLARLRELQLAVGTRRIGDTA